MTPLSYILVSLSLVLSSLSLWLSFRSLRMSFRGPPRMLPEPDLQTPVRSEITVLQADAPSDVKLGFTVSERMGVAVVCTKTSGIWYTLRRMWGKLLRFLGVKPKVTYYGM